MDGQKQGSGIEDRRASRMPFADGRPVAGSSTVTTLSPEKQLPAGQVPANRPLLVNGTVAVPAHWGRSPS